MLHQGTTEELRDVARHLLELAERHADPPKQRELASALGASNRMDAVRPLVWAWAWAIAAQSERSSGPTWPWTKRARDRSSSLADTILDALAELLSRVGPRQCSRLDQELRTGGYQHSASAAWWKLGAASALDVVPETAHRETAALAVLCSHPSGYLREASLRRLTRTPLEHALPFLLLRANDWVRQVRTIAHARLLDLDVADVGVLASWLELVEQLASQGRREPGAVEHLLNLLRTRSGMEAVRAQWESASPSLHRAALRFSWDNGERPEAIITRAMTSKDPLVRRWSVARLEGRDEPARMDALRQLARDRVPMVVEAALDALEPHVQSEDQSLLEDLRRAPSSIVQLTARFILGKRFGDRDHRPVYLSMLASDDEKEWAAAAVGLSATGEPGDYAELLDRRLEAGPKVRRKLLAAAASLDLEGSREAIFADLAHQSRAVSKVARYLLRKGAIVAEGQRLREMLNDDHPHVRESALFLARRLGHWGMLPFVLQALRDEDAAVTALASTLLAGWRATYVRATYRPPAPSRSERIAVRGELDVLPPSIRHEIESWLSD